MELHFINITDIQSAQFDEWFEQMSEKRRHEVSRTASEKKRKLRIAADALCRRVIAEYCSVSPDAIVFEYGEKGKPYAKGLPVHFSISHSGNYAVCAVADSEIGADIEKIRAITPRAADRFATEAEKEYISASQNGFFEIWTLKEAYFKCIGTGLGSDIKSVSFEVCENRIICSEKGFELSFHEIDKNYICSVCIKAAQP